MKKFQFNSIIRKQQLKVLFIETIWKSWYRHLNISVVIDSDVAKNIFLPKYIFFVKEVEYLCSFLCLVMVSVPLCYKYLVLYDNLFINSKASIDDLEKSYLNIRKHPSWCFNKTFTPKIPAYFAFFPGKHPALSSF